MSSPSTDNADHMHLFALVLLKAADVLDEMRAKEEIEGDNQTYSTTVELPWIVEGPFET